PHRVRSSARRNARELVFMSTAANRLQIRRFCAEYLVPAQHPNPYHLKARLDETIERQLAPALSDIFSHWFSSSDSSIWIIRRLEVRIALNAALERDQITRAIGAQIGRSLGLVLQDRSDSTNVLRFPNRAAYLASFLFDLAADTAWNNWYYESFAGLKSLPVSSALRTAIGDDAGIGLDALHSLSEPELANVLRRLTTADARRTLDVLAAAGPRSN